jgi:hypothetical protein
MVRSADFAVSIRSVTQQDHRLHELQVQQHGDEALTESLRLQRTVRERFASRNGRRGKRRKVDVIDLDAPLVVVRRRTSRLLVFFFWVEVVVAVIAVSVLAVYTYVQRDTLF